MSASDLTALLKQFFQVPYFGDDVTRRRAQLLSFVINLYLVVALSVTVLYSTIGFSNIAFPLLAFCSCFPVVWVRVLIQRGKVMQGANIFVDMLAVLIPLAVLLGRVSVETVAITGFQFFMIIMAGLLLDRKGLLNFLILTIVFNGIVFYAETGKLYTAVVARTPVVWVVQSIAYVAGAGLLWRANRLLQESFARIAGELAERRRMDEREKRRSDILEQVIRLGKNVTETADLRTVARRVWEAVHSDLGFERVGLFIYNAQDNVMQGTYGTDRSGCLVEAWNVRFGLGGEGLFGKIISRPDGFYYTDDYASANRPPPGDNMSGVKGYAAVAAWANEKPVAIICVDQLLSGRPIEDEQLEGLRLFAGYAGLAIENTRLNSQLEQRVEERTAQLESANYELEAFSYSVSHDLRAPLRAVTGFAKILKEEYADSLPAEAQGYLLKIAGSGMKMGELIDELLTLSKIGRKQIMKEPIDLNAIVRAVIESLSAETENRQVEWILEPMPFAQGDVVLIQQVYANLLNNAVKYTRQRDPSRIEVGSLDQDHQTVYFVRDNGAGFDMKYADKLFGVFQRLHREEEFEGTGIGLATVKRIVSRHGGRIWADAEVDRGATFYFTLG